MYNRCMDESECSIGCAPLEPSYTRCAERETYQGWYTSMYTALRTTSVKSSRVRQHMVGQVINAGGEVEFMLVCCFALLGLIR